MAYQHIQELKPCSCSQILLFAFPASIESLFFMLLGIVDQIFISYISENALGAVGLINIIFLYAELTLSSFGLGMSSIISKEFGRSNPISFSQISTQFTSLCTIFSFIFSALFIFYCDSFLLLLGANNKISEIGAIYISLAGWAFPLAILKEMIAKTLRATGDSKTPMFISIFVILLNTALNYIAVFGLFIINPSGVHGISLATFTSAMCGTLLSVFFISKNSFYRFCSHDILKLRKKSIQNIITFSIPIISCEVFRNLSILSMFFFYTKLGTTELVSGQILFTIETFFITVAYGLSPAGLVLIGHQIGRKQYYFAKITSHKIILLGFLISIVTGILTIYSSNILSFFYQNLDITTISYIATGLIFFGIAQPIKTLSMIFRNGIFRSLSYNDFLMKLEVASFSLIIILSFILSIEYGIFGIIIANIISESVKTLLYMRKYSQILWSYS